MEDVLYVLQGELTRHLADEQALEIKRINNWISENDFINRSGYANKCIKEFETAIEIIKNYETTS